LADVAAGRLSTTAGLQADAVDAELRIRARGLIEYGDWLAIDAHERERGAAQGRPRVKLTRREELLSVARRR
jgi:ferredoxin--NADP+ reductase